MRQLGGERLLRVEQNADAWIGWVGAGNEAAEAALKLGCTIRRERVFRS